MNILPYQNIVIVKRDAFGNIISNTDVHNLITDSGLNVIRDHLLSTGGALPAHHFTLGSGSTAAASTDIALQSSLLTVAFTETTIRIAGVTFQGTIYTTDGLGSTFKEIGIFTSSSELIGRALITPVLIKSSSRYTTEVIEWKFDLTAVTT